MRRKSQNTFQVAFRIPAEWLERADALAEQQSRRVAQGFAAITRTDIIRSAIARGLAALESDGRGTVVVGRRKPPSLEKVQKDFDRTRGTPG
jgi:predicted DNA-binding protein